MTSGAADATARTANAEPRGQRDRPEPLTKFGAFPNSVAEGLLEQQP